MFRIASFDIGKKNFAFTVETFNVDLLVTHNPIAKHQRYYADGTPTQAFQDVIDRIGASGEVELYHKEDLTKNCDPKSYLDPETFHNMTDLLSKFDSIWDTCQIFLVERQMSYKTKFNTMALKLGQHCLAYFRIRYGRMKHTIEFPAYHKTQVLGAPRNTKGKAKYKRKKWAVEEATRILLLRKNSEAMTRFRTNKKKDDIADCLLQTNALVCMIQQDNYLCSLV